MVRIDHFRGFEAYYAIPYGDETAEDGHWVKGPGHDLFEAIKAKLGKVPIIAEDLGVITPEARSFIRKCGYPGMKVMQFAFDENPDNAYLPHNHEKNYVVYTGTHDNDTIVGWMNSISDGAFEQFKRYTGIDKKKKRTDDVCIDTLITITMASVSNIAIVPIQDYLKLGSTARMNKPATVGNNWKWRMLKKEATPELAARIKEVCEVYGRCDRPVENANPDEKDAKK